MRNAAIILLFIMNSHFVNGQVYTGASLDKLKSYRCSLKINQDSSVLLVYHNKSNKTYGEHFGKISKINDTLYHVSSTMTLGKFDNMRLYIVDTLTNRLNDTDYFCLEKKFIEILLPIKIEYANGRIENYTSNCIALDRRLFNKTKGFNYYLIQTNAHDKIDGSKLSFRVEFGSVPSFEKGYSIDFNIVKKGDYIYSVNAFIMPTGQFRLKKRGT